MTGCRIAVDVGGTFTDVVVADGSGHFAIGKALTDRQRAFRSIQAGVEIAAAELGIGVSALVSSSELFLYGTTRATNAIVEGKTARTAFLTTAGFPDVLLLKEGGKADPHHLRIEYPAPYIPRSCTFEVPERINAEGGVENVLDEDAVRALLMTLPAMGIQAIAVCLLWSIANPAHELRVGELIRAHLPSVPYTLSHQLNPILREYRRASSTAIDASLKPLMQDYLVQLEADLRAAGYACDVLISTSIGGVMHLRDVVERPIFMVKSGPAMAPVAARAYALAEALPRDAIVCDTGGTTFDVSLIRDGAVEFSRDTWIGPRWSGHNVGMASVSVHSIGAGGGSIARVDAGGLLCVGPQSAGAEPGPACYAQGGLDATVTDAAVVLGYIDPDYFLGGRMRLDATAARAVVETVARQLGESVEGAAYAIMAVANESMIQAIKELTINEGLDPAESILVGGGGAAGLNIVPIAGELGCRTVLVPRTAGALSATGMQFSDIITEAGASHLTASDEFDLAGVNATLASIDRQLEAFAAPLVARGIGELRRQYFVEARYRFQVWEIEVPVPGARFASAQDVAALVAEFHRVHERIFAIRDAGQIVECLNWRGRLVASMGSRPRSVAPPPGRTPVACADRRRDAHFGQGATKTPIYLGRSLRPGMRIEGPAIIEEPTATLVVYPGATAAVTAGSHYLLTVPMERRV